MNGCCAAALNSSRDLMVGCYQGGRRPCLNVDACAIALRDIQPLLGMLCGLSRTEGRGHGVA